MLKEMRSPCSILSWLHGRPIRKQGHELDPEHTWTHTLLHLAGTLVTTTATAHIQHAHREAVRGNHGDGRAGAAAACSRGFRLSESEPEEGERGSCNTDSLY